MHISERLDKETGRDYAKRVISDNIINFELEPGSMVSEQKIATLLGLSRMPVREAIIELTKSEIVEVLPQRGSRVALIDYDLVEEAYFARLVMEKAIVEMTCEIATDEDITRLEANVNQQKFYLKNFNADELMKLDDDFHKTLFKICNKMRCYEMVHSMNIHFDRVRKLALNNAINLDIVDEHEKLCDAIRNRNAKEAVKLLDAHLTRFKIDEKQIEKKYPDYIK